jgi:thiosulfate dehydrogenase [quinone] large subunit
MSESMNTRKYSLGLLRIALGAYMLWAFLDKTFGLDFTTTNENAWINGGSPTTGFLKFGATGGWFEDLFTPLAGQVWVDWLFMIGLLGIGLALILGVGVRIAGMSGTLLMTLMYLATLPFEKSVDHNPLIDDHIIYGLAFLFFAFSTDVGKYLGLGAKWEKLEVVQKYPILT